MKTKYIKGIMALSITALLFSSCLKDPGHVFNPEITSPNVAQFFNAGLQNFSTDAITSSDTTTFAVGVTLSTPPTTPTTVTLAVDNSLIATYNAANSGIVYLPIPAAAYKLATSVTIPAGKNSVTTTVIIDRAQLDPAGSYMLPVKLVGASPSIPIAANLNTHYFHIIGNDFAGTYTYDFRRWQNGTGPGAGIIPSLSSAGAPVDITDLGETVTIYPVSPVEFQMVTEYNGQGVNYDVTFTRTVNGSTVTYTDWKVSFLPGDLAKWAAAASPITNFVPPAFTIPPPATNSDPKKFELNFASGGSAPGRYIDDTYTKK
ncbi:MAG: hypothetical protein JWP37_378 [Mucilaginibacter sp.]|nr:hypothetical protein [Mucilaginibacter sp.]